MDDALLQRTLEAARALSGTPPAEAARRLMNRRDIDFRLAMAQIEGQRCLAAKVPSWARVADLRYPLHLSLEQCSSQATASYKHDWADAELPATERRRMADMTGGLGVDFVHLAPLFDERVYIEQQEELCRLARHNFPLLGLPDCRIEQANGLAWALQQPDDSLDLLFADPARRDAAGRKVVGLADCEPDVGPHLHRLLQKARCVMLKLSPMLDVSRVLTEVPHVAHIGVYGTGGECKELVLSLRRGAEAPTCTCRADGLTFSFSPADECAAEPVVATGVDAYLFDPDATVMKAAPFRTLCHRLGVAALHANSHLYTAATDVAAFPGRRFCVTDTGTFGKADRRRLKALGRVHLAVRNFPERAPQLLRQLGLREGGNTYVFATTLARGERVWIAAERL